MPDPLERRPENREIEPDHVQPMPAHLPTEDTDNPHSTPLRREQERSEPQPDRPLSPDQDPTP
ncbi:MAG: hypothetical protein ABS75_01905 [Pelagibacterium sp. SCN 63-23]|nr:MAG: hypothetical protein ABS75_01905 [Pelagibacterium sp. SCN 63-23]